MQVRSRAHSQVGGGCKLRKLDLGEGYDSLTVADPNAQGLMRRNQVGTAADVSQIDFTVILR